MPLTKANIWKGEITNQFLQRRLWDLMKGHCPPPLAQAVESWLCSLLEGDRDGGRERDVDPLSKGYWLSMYTH